MCEQTLIDVLPFVERSQGEIVGETTESVDQMSAQVRVDILRQEFRLSRTISRPISVVTNDALIVLGNGADGLGRWSLRHHGRPY